MQEMIIYESSERTRNGETPIENLKKITRVWQDNLDKIASVREHS
jgi:hypothetical protein